MLVKLFIVTKSRVMPTEINLHQKGKNDGYGDKMMHKSG